MAGPLKLEQLAENAVEMPKDYEEKCIERFSALHKGFEEANTLKSALQNIGEKYLKADGEVGVTASETLNRLPERLEKAKHGDAFLLHQRKEALRAFDAAKVDPAKAEMSGLDKKLRARIANSNDLDYLAEELERYQQIAKDRLGLNKSSESEDLGKPEGGEQGPTSLQEAEIRENALKLHAGGKK
jgi:hypothetical protein